MASSSDYWPRGGDTQKSSSSEGNGVILENWTKLYGKKSQIFFAPKNGPPDSVSIWSKIPPQVDIIVKKTMIHLTTQFCENCEFCELVRWILNCHQFLLTYERRTMCCMPIKKSSCHNWAHARPFFFLGRTKTFIQKPNTMESKHKCR